MDLVPPQPAFELESGHVAAIASPGPAGMVRRETADPAFLTDMLAQFQVGEQQPQADAEKRPRGTEPEMEKGRERGRNHLGGGAPPAPTSLLAPAPQPAAVSRAPAMPFAIYKDT